MAHLPYGCTLDQKTTLYKDTRYIKVHDFKSDISLHQLEKQNSISEILGQADELKQESKKKVEINFWARPVLEDNPTCNGR